MIQFACSSCGTDYRVPDECRGRTTVCRQCKKSIQVPGAKVSAEAIAQPVWRAALGEFKRVPLATFSQATRLVQFAGEYNRNRQARRQAAILQRELGERLYQDQLGDEQIRREIQELDQAGGGSKARRRKLLRKLAEPFLEQPPLLTLVAECQRAKESRAAADLLKVNLKRAHAALPPGDRAERLRVAAGCVLATIVAVWFGFLLLRPGTTHPDESIASRTPSPEKETPTTPGSNPASLEVDRPGRLPDYWVVADREKPMVAFETGGHTAAIKRVFLTPDGKQAITVSLDKTVRITDVPSGETRRVIRLPIAADDNTRLEAAELSQDGKLLVVAGPKSTYGASTIPLYLLSVDSGQLQSVLSGPHSQVRALALSHDGKSIAVGSEDTTIRIYETGTGHLIKELQGHQTEVIGLAFALDGKSLASAAQDGTARLWSIWSGKELTTFRDTSPEAVTREGQTDNSIQCASIAWAPDGKHIAIGSRNGFIRLFDASGKFVKAFQVSQTSKEKPAIAVTTVVFTSDSRRLLFAGSNEKGSGDAGILDLQSGERTVTFAGFAGGIQAASLSADGAWAISASTGEPESCIWRTEDGTLVQRLQGHGRPINVLAWCADAKTIAWGEGLPASGKMPPRPERTFDLDRLAYDEPPTEEKFPLASRGRTRTGKYTVNVHGGADLARYRTDLRDPRVFPAFKPEQPDEFFYTVTFFGEDRVLVGAKHGIYLIDVENLSLIRKYRGHAGPVIALAPSPDGRFFASGSLDQTIRIWDPAQEAPLLSLLPAGNEWIAWTQNGYYAASPGGERLMGWLTHNGPETLSVYQPAVQFHRSLFHPDVIPLVLATGSVDKAVAQAEKDSRPESVPLKVDQVRPPLAAITYPVVGQQVSSDAVEIRAAARSAGKYPIAALRLLIDGQLYGGEQGVRAFSPPRSGDVEASWKVALPPGLHQLRVEAESAVSSGLSPIVEVTARSIR